MRVKRRKKTIQKAEPPRVLLGVMLPLPTAQGILAIAELEEWSVSKVLAHIVADWFKEADREPLIKHLLATLALNRALSKEAVKVRQGASNGEQPRANKGRPLSPAHRAAIKAGIRRAKRERNRKGLEQATRARQANPSD